MIKFRPSIFLRSFDLFVLLSRNNLALVGQFVSVVNSSHSRIVHIYMAKTIVFPAVAVHDGVSGAGRLFPDRLTSTRPALHTSAFIMVFYRMS